MSPDAGWALQKQLWEGLAARPGLFSIQESALLAFLLHKQYSEFGSFNKKTREQIAAMWGVSPERIRQIVVGLEFKRALARIGRGSSKQVYAVTLPAAFAFHDDRSNGETQNGFAPKQVWGWGQTGLGVGANRFAPSQGGDLYDLSDQYVQEATAAPRPPSPRSKAPLFDGEPLPTNTGDPRHADLLNAREEVIRKLRKRVKGLITQLLHNPGLAGKHNGGAAIESESALDHALRELCAHRRVEGWKDHLDLLTATVAFEWTKHQVLHGAIAEYPSRGARRRRRAES